LLQVYIKRCSSHEVKLANEIIFAFFNRYGVKEFLVIHPAEDTEAVDSESKCHLLLSSIGIAATNSKWYAIQSYPSINSEKPFSKGKQEK